MCKNVKHIFQDGCKRTMPGMAAGQNETKHAWNVDESELQVLLPKGHIWKLWKSPVETLPLKMWRKTVEHP